MLPHRLDYDPVFNNQFRDDNLVEPLFPIAFLRDFCHET